MNSTSTDSRWRRPRMRMRSRHSRRRVPMILSQVAFARGVRTGVLTIRMPSDLKTSSNDRANLQSRSRIKNLTDGLRSAQPKVTLRACWVTQPAAGLVVMPARWTTRECRSMTDQYVEAAKKHGVDVEEVTGHHGRGLRLQELVPGRSSPPWYGIDAIALQDRPDRRGADGDPHGGQLTVNASIPPGRVLGGQPADKCH